MELKKGRYYYFYYNQAPSGYYEAVVKLDRTRSPNQKTDYYGHSILLIKDTIGWTSDELYLKKEGFVHEVKPINGKITKETHPELFL